MTSESSMAGHTPGPASPAKEYEPIVHLVTALENAGQQLTSSGGMLSSPDGEIHIARRVLSRFDVRRR